MAAPQTRNRRGSPPLRRTPKGLTYAQGRPHPRSGGRTQQGSRSGGSWTPPAPQSRQQRLANAHLQQRAAAGGILGGARKVTGAGTVVGKYSARGMLTAELLAGAGIVAIRAVADYEPQSDGTLKGKIGHPSGQYGPLPILAGLIGTFFLLSFLAARGGNRGKVAVIAGGLIVLVLGMKSVDEMTTVSGTFSSFGKGKVPAGDWQTAGTQAGAPVQGSSSSSSGSSSGKSGSSKSGSGSGLPPLKPNPPVYSM